MADDPKFPPPWQCMDCPFSSKNEDEAAAHRKESKHGMVHNILDGDGNPIT